MAKNDFLTFADAVDARVLDQAGYEALTTLRAKGFDSGIAEPDQLNKVWRQSSAISSMVAQFISDTLNADVLDDGNAVALLAQYKSALSQSNALSVKKTSATGSAIIPAGPTSERDDPADLGFFRYNLTTRQFEGFTDAGWGSVGGGQMYGTAPVKGIFYNAQIIAEDITVLAGQNGGSFGPIEVANGFSVTVASGSVWSVV